ncbi:MAG: beta-galactosidase [Kiritimatiellae bacterium]|nr:beta-galactosidase [Kiritimatiellia bacterium]MDD5520989.1 beta-galactosidase [Kiritimatiellia bacterium]
MNRRKFIKYVSAGGGALLAGVDPSVAGEDRSRQASSGKKDKSTNSPSNRNLKTINASCKLRQYNDKPTVFVDEKPYFPLAYLSYFPKQFRYKNMRKSGIKFFSLSITLGDGWFGAYKNDKVRLDKKGIWDAPGKIDFEVFDKSINEILEVAPDAYVFPRIFCDSPGWWNSSHPAETNRTYKDGLPMRQSFSSLVWRTETAEVLRKIVQHVYQSSYANRFIGIHVTAGETEEGVHHEWLGHGDYSMAAQSKFRQWLLCRYHNDKNLIRKHFNKTIDQIGIPSPEEREKAGFGDFFDPEKSRLAIDYRFFRCEELVESFDFLCKAVKEESNGNFLTGIFYGHTLTQWLDHMAFSLMLKSPNIDFYSSTTFGTETDSIQKANKIFYNEGDERTCLGRWISETRPEIDPYHEYDQEGWLRHETMEKSLEHLKSEFTRTICTSSIIWWFDLWGGWYDHDRILNLFSEMQKVGDESIRLPRSSVSEICVIVDEKSFLYLTLLRRASVSDLPWINAQMGQIGKIGAPYDIYLLDDLKDLDISKYKMLIFLNTFLLTQSERQMISRKCMCNNRILLWFYAPGLIGDNISIDNVSSLVNMELSSEEKRAESEIDIKISDQKLTYKGSRASPFLYIKSGASEVYGYTRDKYAVLAEKKEKDWSNILACNPPVPWQLIQYLAVRSGVHIYSNAGDIVYANKSYLSIRAAKPGKRLIQLPGKFHLRELLDSGREFKSDNSRESKPDKEFEINFSEAGSVEFFQMIPEKII